MPRVTQAMKAKQRLAEIIEDGGIIVPGGRTWFYIYAMKEGEALFYNRKSNEKFGIFFPSTGMDLWFTGDQAKIIVEFLKQNKLAE
jgi:hypothetical protein